MNVEGGTISAGIGPVGGIVVSAGPAVNVGGAIEISAPGLAMGPDIGIGSTIVNEGPVAPSFLGNTIPLTVDRSNPTPSIIEQTEEVAARVWDRAENVLVEAETEVKLGWQPILTPGVSPQATNKVAVEAKSEPKPKEEQITAFTFIKPELASQRKEVEVEQIKIETELENRKSQAEEQDLDEVVKRRFLVDEQALQVRLAQLRQAIKMAGETTVITGEIIERLMPEENDSNRSEALRVDDPDRRYPDGGYEKTLRELGLLGELRSEEEAFSKGKMIVFDNGPVKKGKEGKVAPQDHIRKTYEHFPIKPSPVYIEVERRKFKKSA